MREGYMDCPSCGRDVTELPADASGVWWDGDEVTCACGQKLRVRADGETARFVEVETDNGGE